MQDQQRGLIAQSHFNNIKKYDHIEGVILGGSNSAYGLSAKEFSNSLNSKWYNLSLLNEGFSNENYLNYIEKTITQEQRKNIKSVVYSSITPLRKGRIKIENKKIPYGIEGDKRFKLIGSISMAAYIKNYILKKSSKKYPLPDSFGDFDFNSCNHCTSEFSVQFKVEPNSALIIYWFIKQLESIRKLFPNATIYFTKPSEYYGNAFIKSQYNSLEKTLQTTIIEYKEKYNIINSHLILEPPFPDKSFCCDAMHHANESGRSFRTKRLIEIIRKLTK